MDKFEIEMATDVEVSEEEIQQMKADCLSKYPDAHGLTVCVEEEWLGYKPHITPKNYERIRRITGYLVGTLDRFNNGKRAEEHDRVKHSVNA